MLVVSFIVPLTAFRMKPLYCQQCIKGTTGCWRYKQNIQIQTEHGASGPNDLLQHNVDTLRTKLPVVFVALFSYCATWEAASCTKELFCLCVDGSWVSGEKILGSSERRRNVSTLILKHWLKFCSLVRNTTGASHKGNLIFEVLSNLSNSMILWSCMRVYLVSLLTPPILRGFQISFPYRVWEGKVLKTLRTCTSVFSDVGPQLKLNEKWVCQSWNPFIYLKSGTLNFLFFFLSERRMPCPFPCRYHIVEHSGIY